MNIDNEIFLLERRRTKQKANLRAKRHTRSWEMNLAVDGFRCVFCGAFVLTESLVSGVTNRNHCPYCLWSRHLDSHRAGDRMSACKSSMKPIGLTLKRTRKKYGLAQCGELMLIHLCEACGHISINRIAADDDAKTIIHLFQDSQDSNRVYLDRYVQEDIRPLEAGDRLLVEARLFGLRTAR